jgi:hypothetical protein
VNGWRAAVLGERATDSGGISLLATLEKRPDFRETVLEEIRPRAVWWEMTPSTEGLAAVRWYSAAGYPAAATILESPLWPGEPPGSVGRPLLRVWWSPDQEFPPSGAFDRGADFQKLSDLSERTLVLEDDTVRLGTVAIEDHPVEVRPGVREERSCLVVRVHHSLGQPIWVAQRGLTPEGAEHRYFPEANASTSLFWPVTEATAKAGLQRLAFVSVKAFKQEATRRGFVAEFRDLGLPDPAGRLPSPPLPLP